MSSERIEIGKGGVKFSYHRFVSDSSLGFLLILFILPKLMETKVFVLFKNFSYSELFIFLLLLFLATPLGLVLNGLGWIFLEKISSDLTFLLFKLLEKRYVPFISKEEILLDYSFKEIERSTFHFLISTAMLLIDLESEKEITTKRIEAPRAAIKFIRGIPVIMSILAFIYGFSYFYVLFGFFSLIVLAFFKLYTYSEIIKLALFQDKKHLDSLKSQFQNFINHEGSNGF